MFRPKTQKRFNGAVMLDWVNVTAQFENGVDMAEGREVVKASFDLKTFEPRDSARWDDVYARYLEVRQS